MRYINSPDANFDTVGRIVTLTTKHTVKQRWTKRWSHFSTQSLSVCLSVCPSVHLCSKSLKTVGKRCACKLQKHEIRQNSELRLVWVECSTSSSQKACQLNIILCRQVAQLSQRDRAAGWVSYRQKVKDCNWETIFYTRYRSCLLYTSDAADE